MDIIDGMDFQPDDSVSYLEKSSSEVWLFPDDVLNAAEQDTKEGIISYCPEELFDAAQRLVQSSNSFIELPSKFDIHEYSVMENFCYAIADEEMQERALDAIHGRGSFRRFKDLMHRADLIDDLYKYRAPLSKKR